VDKEQEGLICAERRGSGGLDVRLNGWRVWVCCNQGSLAELEGARLKGRGGLGLRSKGLSGQGRRHRARTDF